MNSQAVIETKDLTKTYGNFIAVDKLNLRIGEGEIFGFLGPNGAGKTTTILMLLGLTEPTSGNAHICGYNPTREPLQVKKLVGYLPEKVGFYEDLTAMQNLEYTAHLNGLSWNTIRLKIDEVLNLVGLCDVTNKEVGQFSHGMKQRLGIADVMIKDPKVVFFDEPTSGIDPKGTEEMLELISKMASRKITAIVSSHQLHHIQKISTRIGIMSKGRLVIEGAIDKLGRDAISGGKFQIEVQASPITAKLIEALEKINGVVKVEKPSDTTLLITSEEDLRSQISKKIVDNDSMLTGMKIEEYGLEEIYMKYFKESQKCLD
jgi:ABC-2 type transport system ATP-binding protein